MTFGTHIAFASVLYLGGATLFGYKPDGIGWLLAAVASLGPDVDLPTSKVGRLFFWLSVPLERRFGHRTITHSVVGLLTVAAIALPLWWVRPLYFWCVLGGYWSHIWIDMVNVRVRICSGRHPCASLRRETEIGAWKSAAKRR